MVGEGAAELGTSTGSAKAKAMMEKMGWKSGEGLGTESNKGIVEPIQHVVRYSRAGLG
jgi:G-patch domain